MPERLEMRHVNTILLLLSSAQRFDNVVQITHSSHNFIRAEIPMEELGRSSFLPDGTVNEYEIPYGEVDREPPAVVPRLCLD